MGSVNCFSFRSQDGDLKYSYQEVPLNHTKLQQLFSPYRQGCRQFQQFFALDCRPSPRQGWFFAGPLEEFCRGLWLTVCFACLSQTSNQHQNQLLCSTMSMHGSDIPSEVEIAFNSSEQSMVRVRHDICYFYLFLLCAEDQSWHCTIVAALLFLHCKPDKC